VWRQLSIAVRMRLTDRIGGKIKVVNGCWLWSSVKRRGGYGRVWWAGRYRPAATVVWERLIGPLGEGRILDHFRLNPDVDLQCSTSCVRPDHLVPATMRENTLRGRSPMAAQSKQTHCKRGHSFTPDNTWLSKNRMRTCLTCQREKRRVLRGSQPRVFREGRMKRFQRGA